MNRRILVVDRSPARREETRAALGVGYEVHGARDAGEALALCRRRGPFSVAIAVHTASRPDDPCGIGLLGRLSRIAPDTTRIVLAEEADIETALQALHQGSAFRFLLRSSGAEALRAAVEEGLERFRRIEEERLLVDQLQFSREALMLLTGVLERRLTAHSDHMSALEHYTKGLGEARSVEDVAVLAAEACATLLGRRVVRVLLTAPGVGAADARVGDGPLEEESLIHPVLGGDQPLGHVALERLSPEGKRLTGSEQRMLSSLTSAAGMAVSNLMHRRERDEAQRTTIYALARLAENRDDDTGRHLDRVSEYCRLIAEGLAADGVHGSVLTPAYVCDLVLSAPLHDIGKVGIPDSILLKPGRLTEAEWSVMRTHTLIGAETLQHVLETSGEQGFLRMGYEIALCHHERWDGTGYPRGLAGEDTPLCARIVALADCYDALTTWRPYKDPWPHERAIEYVLSMRGSQFDPDVVDAFLRRADEVERIREELADAPDSGDLPRAWTA